MNFCDAQVELGMEMVMEAVVPAAPTKIRSKLAEMLQTDNTDDNVVVDKKQHTLTNQSEIDEVEGQGKSED